MHLKTMRYEVKNFGEEEDKWQEVPENMVMVKLVKCFDTISPILAKMLQGNQIIAQTEIYRKKITVRCVWFLVIPSKHPHM